MDTSSTACQSLCEPDPTISTATSPMWEYRRSRNHLFPLDEYRDATTNGGEAHAYCGIVEAVPRLTPDDVEEAYDASPDDCVTCVDIWLGRTWVRL